MQPDSWAPSRRSYGDRVILEPRTSEPDWPAYIAECIGTMLFVFAAAGSLTMAFYMGAESGGILAIAATQALALTAVIGATVHLSGAHLNPAVTIAVLTTGRMSVVHGVAYLVAQAVGAIVATIFIGALLPVEAVASAQAGLPSIDAVMTTERAFAIELVLSALVAWCWFATIFDPRGRQKGPVAGLAVGAAFFVAVMIAVPLSGAALNPARAIGPALVEGQDAGLWVYLLGPTFGAILVGTLYRLTWMRTDSDTES